MANWQKSDKWTFMVAMLVGIGGVLYGYDIGVVSGALLFIHKSIPMNASQTGVIVGAVLAGGLVGTLLAGPLADLYGRRFMIASSCLIFMVGVACILLAHSFETMLLARILLGIGVGIVAVAVPLYVVEVMPPKDRGKYVTFFQLFLTFGIVLAYFIDLAFTPSGNWRGMFAVVFIPAIILFVGMFFLPETPRWLVANDREHRAKKVLSYVFPQDQIADELQHIKNSLHVSQGGWTDLFNRRMWLPLFIAVSIAILNQVTGINSFLQYAPHLLKQAGLGSNMTVMLGSAGIGMLNFICTLAAIFFVDRVGRRPLLIIGVTGVVIAEVFLGAINIMQLEPGLLGTLSLVGLLAFIVSFAIGPGVVVWLAISELFPTRVRGKGIALCLFFNSLAGTVLASEFLVLINKIGMAGTYWFCAICSLIYLWVAIFYLPETKAKRLEDIQAHFETRSTEAVLDVN